MKVECPGDVVELLITSPISAVILPHGAVFKGVNAISPRYGDLKFFRAQIQHVCTLSISILSH